MFSSDRIKFARLKIYLGWSLILFVSILGIVFYTSDYVFAETTPTTGFDNPNPDVEKLQQSATLELNKGNIKDPQTLIGRVIKSFVVPIGMLALVWVVVAGIMFMTSAGNADRTQKAINIIVWVVFGMLGITASYMVVAILFKFLSS